MTPLVYKVLRKLDKNSEQNKNFYIDLKMKNIILPMQKKSEQNFTSIEIDNITGNYYTIIPEWVMHDQDWFEGTSLKWGIEVDEVIIKEDE